MTRIEIIETVLKKFKAGELQDQGACLYVSCVGPCAVGCLLTDEEADFIYKSDTLNNRPIRELIDGDILPRLAEHRELLDDIQNLFDSSDADFLAAMELMLEHERKL